MRKVRLLPEIVRELTYLDVAVFIKFAKTRTPLDLTVENQSPLMHGGNIIWYDNSFLGELTIDDKYDDFYNHLIVTGKASGYVVFKDHIVDVEEDVDFPSNLPKELFKW